MRDEAYAVYRRASPGSCAGITHLLALPRSSSIISCRRRSSCATRRTSCPFLAANYALYLHISGQFHIITGVLHLFGFDLPRTHHNYFLASSCQDIWRRINIYWKDFMTKVFFFPAFFTLRGLGTRTAVVVGALWVFLATWLLHSYQFFWLIDSFPLSLTDACRWLVVGSLVAVKLQWDLSRAACVLAGSPLVGHQVVGAVVARSMKIVGMFLLVSLFWASWSKPGMLAQLMVPGSDGHALGTGLGLCLGLLALVVLAGPGNLCVTESASWAGCRLPIHGALRCLAGHAADCADRGREPADLRPVCLCPQRMSSRACTRMPIRRWRPPSSSRDTTRRSTCLASTAVAWLAALEGRRPPDPGYAIPIFPGPRTLCSADSRLVGNAAGAAA